jgi:hypothetical protein
VLTFKQAEDEGIDEAWTVLMNYLSEARTWDFLVTKCCILFYFSLTPNSSRLVIMCAGGDIMEKTISEAAQILQRISNG